MARGRKICGDCGEGCSSSIKEEYRYVESGLDNVFLEDVEVEACGCGEAVLLRALPTLHRVIAMCFSYKPARLRGREIRFIRSVLGMNSSSYATTVGVRPETLSRIENGREEVSAARDKLIRMRTALELMEHRAFEHAFDLEKLIELVDGPMPESDHGLCLYLRYSGPYLQAEKPVEFEFRPFALVA